MNKSSLGNVYLACPYSDLDKQIMEYRCYWVSKAAAYLMKEKNCSVFSPISMGHMIYVVDRGIPSDFDFWKTQCTDHILKWATCIVVLMLPGWEDSKGVKYELELARQIGLPIFYINQNFEFV